MNDQIWASLAEHMEDIERLADCPVADEGSYDYDVLRLCLCTVAGELRLREANRLES